MKSILVLAQPSGIVPSAPPAALASTSEISESPSTTADSEVGQHSLGYCPGEQGWIWRV